MPRSEQAQRYHSWYNTRAWRETRERQLHDHPLCVMCIRERRLVRATVCDHIERHNWDHDRFWHGPFQSLCERHHNITKQRSEHRGYDIGVTDTGRPIDMHHPWNKSS
jgi:5-methylcytosine-specific restriction enzyme A